MTDLPHVKWFVVEPHAESCLLRLVTTSSELHKSARAIPESFRVVELQQRPITVSESTVLLAPSGMAIGTTILADRSS